MQKLFGSFLVIGTTSLAGFVIAERFGKRCRVLKVWLYILELIKTEIDYQRLLPEIFEKFSRLPEIGDFKEAFTKMGERIKFGSEYEIVEAWAHFIKEPEFLILKATDLAVLKELGSFLGSTNRRDQIEKINNCQRKLEFQLKQAEEVSKKQTGVYRYLGFAFGSLLVLWLL